MRIVVSGTNCVRLPLAVLLAQNNHVYYVDTNPENVDKINERISPIRDKDVKEYFNNVQLQLRATLDGASAYREAELIIIAAPYLDSDDNDSPIERIMHLISCVNTDATIVIASQVPYKYIEYIKKKYNYDNLLYFPCICKKPKSLYDYLCPSNIIIGCDEEQKEQAQTFGELLLEGAIKKDVVVEIKDIKSL